MSISVPNGSDYVALGSSFGAGPGLKPKVAGRPRGSGRSMVNYAHLFAASAGLALTDETFSGATIEGMLTSQLPLVPASARLVTITGGGNDLGYLGGITTGSSFLRVPFAKRLGTWLDPSTLDARVASLQANLTTLVEGVHTRATGASVVLVGYLTIVPPSGSPLKQSLVDWAQQVSARLTAVNQALAASHGCTFVDVGAASVDHHAWSAEPWVNRFSFRGGAPFHPNYAGMRAVAEMLGELVDVQA